MKDNGVREDFRAVKVICWTLTCWTHAITRQFKLLGYSAPRGSPLVHPGLWRKGCQCRCINCNTKPLRESCGLITRGDPEHELAEVSWKISVRLVKFCKKYDYFLLKTIRALHGICSQQHILLGVQKTVQQKFSVWHRWFS